MAAIWVGGTKGIYFAAALLGVPVMLTGHAFTDPNGLRKGLVWFALMGAIGGLFASRRKQRDASLNYRDLIWAIGGAATFILALAALEFLMQINTNRENPPTLFKVGATVLLIGQLIGTGAYIRRRVEQLRKSN